MFWYDRGSRGHHVAREILGGYWGNVQCDGYEAYDLFEKMPGITVHGCWAHVRRKFGDSLKEDERLAMEGILFIRKLYKVESDADDKGLSAEERKDQRRKISYPTILMFEKWILRSLISGKALASNDEVTGMMSSAMRARVSALVITDVESSSELKPKSEDLRLKSS